jgi:hypothetical protein
MSRSSWASDEDLQLRKLALAGLSLPQIAREWTGANQVFAREPLS